MNDKSRYEQVHLFGIESAAGNIANGAASLQRYVRSLEGIPHYETLAEDAMNKAEETLTAALLAVKLCKSEYARKPVVIPQFLEAAE